MLKKTIEFEDLDGNKLTEDFYFSISKAEIAEMELSTKGGMQDHLTAIVKDENGKEIMRIFKDIIGMAVGYRSEDGRRFIKNQEMRDDFMQTDAYSELFMELVTDAGKGVEFIRGIMPGDLAKTVTDVELPVATQDESIPLYIREDREPTERELTRMSQQEIQAAFRYRQKQQEESQ